MDVKKVAFGNCPVLSGHKKEEGKPAELDFQTLLREASSTLNGLAQSQSPPAPGETAEIFPSPVFSVQPSDLASVPGGVDQVRSQAVKATENVLAVLEHYQNTMADPRVSLKEMDKVLKSLSGEIEGLDLLSEKVSPSDPLQKIMTEVKILSTVEMEKFDRGEYV